MTMYLNKRLALEVESEDRLSNMPRNVIEYILDLMPIQDAARTSILVLGEAPVVPRIAPVVRNCLSHILLNIELTNLAQISYALLFIQCFFNLQMLQIWIDDTCSSAEDVLNYLKAPHNFGRALPNLEQVIIRRFNGSKPELLLIKLLFAAIPSLVRMSIEKERNFSSIQERNIIIELMRYPRASPKILDPLNFLRQLL
ncbi:hypothetical protein RND71_003168 [Anisodus tanguticus]|uniref:Uncharacterized protein n=1 Tax=Anisodus tanguticus TaxID=243964 RepID=A0AAE1SVE7_9SOLA|nr:hypothetical protein RND71_003168 [Anisodus tanguticus]